MSRGNEYRVGKDARTTVNEPKGVTSVKRSVTDHAFQLQVERYLPFFTDPLERDAWYAGVRFAIGYVEHGSALQEMGGDRLNIELWAEHADAFNYSLEVDRRAVTRKPFVTMSGTIPVVKDNSNV